jgi:hypothetical protein
MIGQIGHQQGRLHKLAIARNLPGGCTNESFAMTVAKMCHWQGRLHKSAINQGGWTSICRQMGYQQGRLHIWAIGKDRCTNGLIICTFAQNFRKTLTLPVELPLISSEQGKNAVFYRPMQKPEWFHVDPGFGNCAPTLTHRGLTNWSDPIVRQLDNIRNPISYSVYPS